MRKLALAGIIGPIWFTVLVVVQSLLQPDYSQLAHPISALSAWPLGWLQNSNFFMAGSLLVVYAVTLHRGVQGRRGGFIALLLLVMSGIGVALAGVFPWRRDGVDFSEPALHVVAAVCSFFGAGAGLIAMSWRMAGDPNWARFSKYVLACGIYVLLMFVVVGWFAVEDGAPLHAWAGLLQRMLLAVWFPCTMLLSSRLLKIEKHKPSMREAGQLSRALRSSP
jgi:hypothetical membrane protein